MNSKTTSMLAVAIAVAFSASAATAANRPISATAASPVARHPAPSGSFALLFDQTGSPALSGVVVTKSLDAGSEPYDAEMADDFVVPAGGWAVSQVKVGTFYQNGGTPVNPSTSGNITFYSGVAVGPPGAPVAGCSYSNVPLTYDSGLSISTLTLPTACALPAGTFWIGFSANLSFAAQGGDAYASQQNTTANNVPVWRNPGDAYQTGCTSFSALTTCGFATNGGMTVQLLGQTTPVTLQKFSVD